MDYFKFLPISNLICYIFISVEKLISLLFIYIHLHYQFSLVKDRVK